MNNYRTFRRIFAFLCVAAFLGCLAGCTLYRKAEDAAVKASEILTEVKATVAEFKQHAAAADTDKDGNLSTQEIVTYLLGLFGLGGAGWVAKVRKDRAAHRAETEANAEAIAELQAKVKS